MTEKTKKSEKPLLPVYLIYGKEPFLLEEALGRLKAALEQQSSVGLDVTVFSGASVAPQEILSALDTLPLMSEKRLVIVREAEKLSPAAQTALASYVRHPSDKTCLVLVCGTVRKDWKLYKAIDVKKGVAEYKLPHKGHYPQWIQHSFAKRGKKVDVQAANFLLAEIGFDLCRLNNEVEKISLFYDDRESIKSEEMREIISPGREREVYDFADALAEKNLPQAVLFLRGLLERDEKGTGVFFYLLRHFKGLLRTKACWEKGIRGAELVKAVKASPFLVSKYQSQVKNFTLQELKRTYLLLAEMDFAAKSDKQELGLALEFMVMGMRDSDAREVNQFLLEH